MERPQVRYGRLSRPGGRLLPRGLFSGGCAVAAPDDRAARCSRTSPGWRTGPPRLQARVPAVVLSCEPFIRELSRYLVAQRAGRSQRGRDAPRPARARPGRVATRHARPSRRVRRARVRARHRDAVQPVQGGQGLGRRAGGGPDRRGQRRRGGVRQALTRRAAGGADGRPCSTRPPTSAAGPSCPTSTATTARAGSA